MLAVCFETKRCIGQFIDLITQGLSGIPEVSSGIPSRTQSPPLATNTAFGQSLGEMNGSCEKEAAFNIAKNCERVLSRDLRATFLGERVVARQDSCAMDASQETSMDQKKMKEWVEIWDYAGNSRFCGFIFGHHNSRDLFVFFESTVVGKDLKLG